MRLKRAVFRQLVSEALDALPDGFKPCLENVAVTVEDWPSLDDLTAAGLDPETETLYGLYVGVPLPERNDSNTLEFPDRIIIYQGPIEDEFTTPDAIRREVQTTIVHEIAHFFGFSEDYLAELGWA